MPIRIIGNVGGFERLKTAEPYPVTGTYEAIEGWDGYVSGIEYIYPYIWNGKGGRLSFDKNGKFQIGYKFDVELASAGKTTVWYKTVDNSGDILEWSEVISNVTEKQFTKTSFTGTIIDIHTELSLSSEDIVDESVEVYLNGQLIHSGYSVSNGTITFSPSISDWDVTVVCDVWDVSADTFTIEVPAFQYDVDDWENEYVELQVKYAGEGFTINQARMTALEI